MSDDNCSNHLLTLVHEGSGHLAVTMGATDVCKVPPLPTPTPFINYIESKQLGGGKTVKTFIAGHPIVTKIGVIEPSSNPAHAGVLGGVKSGTYRMEIRQIGSSRDLYAEGNLVCRATDKTTQNHANTTGWWILKLLATYLKEEDENQKKRCTIQEVFGHCLHGRELDYPPGEAANGREPFYLEVLSDDIMTLGAERVNIVPGEEDPACPFGDKHTEWTFNRTGGGEGPRNKTLNGDDVEIGSDLLGMLIDEALAVSAKYKTQSNVKKEQDPLGKGVNSLGKDQQAAAKQEAADKVQPYKHEAKTRARLNAGETKIDPDKVRRTERTEKRREDTRKAAEKRTANENKQKDAQYTNALNVVQNLAKLALLWYAKRNPPVLEIQASACSGTKNAKLVIFPAGKVKFDVFSERLHQAVQALRLVAKIIEKIGEWVGVLVAVKFLEKPQLNITVEYKELTKDWPKNLLKKSQVNRMFELGLSFDPFLSAKIEVQVPIPTFLAPMGAVLGKFLKWLGAEGVVYFSAEVQIVPTAAIKFDEYEEVVGYAKVAIKVEFQLGVRIRWSDVAELWAAGYVETTLESPEWRTTRDHPLSVKVKGDVQLGFKGGAWGDVWGWKKAVEFNYKPPHWKHKMGERWLSFIPMP